MLVVVINMCFGRSLHLRFLLGGCLVGVRSRFCEAYTILGIFKKNTKVLIQNNLQNGMLIQNRQKKSQHTFMVRYEVLDSYFHA